MTKRPHHVFVFDIGPSFSYATAERAHAKARELTAEYERISVYSSTDARPGMPMTRTMYRYGKPDSPQLEQFSGHGWEAAPPATDPDSEALHAELTGGEVLPGLTAMMVWDEHTARCTDGEG